MIVATHLIAGARSGAVLVKDDADRLALLEWLHATVGRVLAYCVMNTHFHVVIEGDPATTRDRAAPAFRSYTRSFNARHGLKGTLLRGRPEPFGKADSIALAKAIDYVHENPISTKPPIVPREVDFEWSSARAFTGLARDRFVDPERARVLLGVDARRIALEHPELAGLEPAMAPCATPGRILSAAAATLRVLPADMASGRRSPELAAARAVYVALGRLESYCDGQLARPLGRSRARTCELSADPDMEAVRMARTLLRDSGLATRIRAFADQGTAPMEVSAV
jgi:hypothetical protein